MVSYFSDRVPHRELREVTLDPQGTRALELTFRFAQPLSTDDYDRLRFEAQTASAEPVAGTLALLSIQVSPGSIQFVLPRLPPDVVRLDALQRACAHRGSPLGPLAARYVVERVASIVRILHAAADLFGWPRVHGALHGGAILIAERGALALVGTGLPALDAFLVPPASDEGAMIRLAAPEMVRRERLDPRTDVYALGVLYYELLSGRPYRAGFSHDALLRAAKEERAPDLPGDLPDPRPDLLALLLAMLEPRRERRLASMESVLELLAREGTSAEELRRAPRFVDALVGEFMSADMEHGPRVLLGEGDPPDVGQVIGTRPAAGTNNGAVIPVEVDAAPERDDWAKVLGESAEPEQRPQQPLQRPPEPPPRREAQLPPPLTLPGAAMRNTPRPPSRGPSTLSGTGRPAAARWKAAALFVAMLLAVGGAIAYKRFVPARNARPPEIEALRTAPVVNPPPPQPKPVQAERKDPPPEVAKPIGLVTVMSQPSGADVELDGGFLGKTPLVFRTRLDKPTYQLTVTAPGYKPYSQRVTVDRQKQALNAMVLLEPK